MKIKAIVTEDTITEYLTNLQSDYEKQEHTILEKMARELVGEYDDKTGGYIAPLMSTKFNPNLFLSGQDEDYWKIEQGDERSTLEIIYTGMRLHDDFNHPMVWWEFATEDTVSEAPRYRQLGRDYAYFQETGRDPVAKSFKAKHKYAVKMGVLAGSNAVREVAGDYLMQLMKK